MKWINYRKETHRKMNEKTFRWSSGYCCFIVHTAFHIFFFLLTAPSTCLNAGKSLLQCHSSGWVKFLHTQWMCMCVCGHRLMSWLCCQHWEQFIRWLFSVLSGLKFFRKPFLCVSLTFEVYYFQIFHLLLGWYARLASLFYCLRILQCYNIATNV